MGAQRVANRWRWVLTAVPLAVLAAACASADAPSASTPTTAPTTRPAVTAPAAAAGSSVATSPASSPPTTAATATAPARAAAAPATLPKPVTMSFSGDLLPHLPVDAQAAAYGRATGRRYDFGPMLAPMRPVVGAVDVGVCHMEVPVAPDGRPSGYPSFGAPRELVDGAASAGFDGCSTASNHSLDRGSAGVKATLDEFDRVKLRHAGTGRNAWEAGSALYVVRGVKVRHLSYAYGFNGYRLPAGQPWAANQIDPVRIRRDAAAARKAGADIVVVSLHWGTEYRSAPDSFQRSVADAILPSPDIDLVIGHHAHVVQPISMVKGTYVVWGLGNQLSNQSASTQRDGLTVVATFGLGWDLRWHVSGMEAVPTWVQPGTYKVLPAVLTLQDPHTTAATKASLRASYDRTVATVRSGRAPGVRIAARP